MSNAAILAPVFAQVALTFATLIGVGSSRYIAVKNREVRMQDVALDSDGWSLRIRKISRNYDNQMQLPLLFYIVVGFFILMGKVDLVAVVLAWVFVTSRYLHSFIHIGSNYMPHRFRIFVFGSVTLLTLWVWLALRVYVIG